MVALVCDDDQALNPLKRTKRHFPHQRFTKIFSSVRFDGNDRLKTPHTVGKEKTEIADLLPIKISAPPLVWALKNKSVEIPRLVNMNYARKSR